MAEQEQCSFGLQPKQPPDDRDPIAIPERTLDDHPVLRNLVERPNRSEGIGSIVDCQEGMDIMEEIAAAGGDVRRYPPISSDTYILLDGTTYLLAMSESST